jgi:serine protease
MCKCPDQQNPCHGRHDDNTPNHDDGAIGNGLSGFVIVRLARDVPPGESPDLRRHAAELELSALGQLLDGLGGPDTRRLITSVKPGELLRMERAAAKSRWRPLNSLTRYWRIDARTLEQPLDELVKRFTRLPGVELAYAELVAHDPAVNAADDTFNAQQGYLDAAPTGINARWAWNQAGGEGQGIGVVDLEQGWRLGHEDLAGKAPTLIFNVNADGIGGYVGNHGTSVMGEIAADDNTRGVVGIAPTLGSLRATSHHDGATNGHVADAAIAALPTMSAGDVLLIEVQRNFLPSEIDVADFDAFRLATARGITVVEAAGNGGADLDAWTDPMGRFRLNRGHADFRDSGAIMVGASQSPVVNGNSHARWTSSNFGSRIDCYAWGENITTCGYGDLTPVAGADADYTAVFGGTSGASPIIVGAAVLIQSMYRTATGTLLSPGQMRGILRDPANGTPQSATVAGTIGTMPDLQRIATNVLGLIPDVYLRDAVGDSGAIPNAGALSVSPDVIVRPQPAVNPAASFGEGSGTENDATLGAAVEAGQDNTIYVRMRNRGAASAQGVRATVYWSPVSTLVTPNLWTLIGTTAPVDVPTGNTLVVTPAITWAAQDVPGSGHHCFVAILDHPQDPAPPIPGPTDWDGFRDMIANNNNVAWRNFNVVDDVPADPSADPIALPFLLAGAPGEARRFDLQIAAHLPDDAGLALELPAAAAAALPDHWRERLSITGRGLAVLELPRLRGNAFCGVALHAGAAHGCRFVLRPSKGMANGLHTIEIRQFDGPLQVGGVTWALRPKG